MDAEPIEHLRTNTDAWQARHDEQMALARRAWTAEPTWGIFRVPDSELGVLPSDLEGKDVVELGCGTAYVSAWLAQRGARPVGVDPTEGQLGIARSFQRELDLHFPLVLAAGEQVPLRSGSFDLAISEYGAAIWADPYRWIPEAARLLRPGGQLIFLGNSVLLMLCAPDEDDVPAKPVLLRDQFGMHRFEWPDDPGIEFHLSHGDWVALFRANGFDVDALLELRPHPDATTSYGFVTVDWARRWPAEEVWKVTRTGRA